MNNATSPHRNILEETVMRPGITARPRHFSSNCVSKQKLSYNKNIQLIKHVLLMTNTHSKMTTNHATKQAPIDNNNMSFLQVQRRVRAFRMQEEFGPKKFIKP
jgi:hypothetical protein